MLPAKVWGSFSKKVSHGGTNFFGEKIYGEVFLNGKANDKIMPRWGKSFINDKCIFQ